MIWLAAELPPELPATCIVQAAERYKVPVAALVSVAKQEGGKVGVSYPRSHGTYYGPFQISDKWLPHFQKWGLDAEQLQHNACANAAAGAYVLAYYKIRERSWYRAIARYNTGSLDTEARQEAGFRYADSVLRHWKNLYEKWDKSALREKGL